ncbi:MAG: helix-turn-helix domain-containing protein [Candidatus Woesearchaeota archaeon]|jgi:DNA-binding HxlR family transcriptional regulator|nr:helix-turn-helix domain-containing protein [Candidatus Woesearchaeota archaeon]MDP7323896.1 helix-turn-helix domain-containing protein [Candidatus Woesearchaeota archaeon]MDP7458229.1 helix-turn-helix domain-containing protein [Candidatus Woesearchaeota archaeon]
MEITCCPIETAFKYLGKKWSINIIRDMFKGKKRFSDFLKANPDLSTKMLSARLKDLEKDGFICKEIVSKSPITVEYKLTKRGKGLNKILYEASVFSVKFCRNEICKKVAGREEEVMKHLAKAFGV